MALKKWAIVLGSALSQQMWPQVAQAFLTFSKTALSSKSLAESTSDPGARSGQPLQLWGRSANKELGVSKSEVLFAPPMLACCKPFALKGACLGIVEVLLSDAGKKATTLGTVHHCLMRQLQKQQDVCA